MISHKNMVKHERHTIWWLVRCSFRKMGRLGSVWVWQSQRWSRGWGVQGSRESSHDWSRKGGAMRNEAIWLENMKGAMRNTTTWLEDAIAPVPPELEKQNKEERNTKETQRKERNQCTNTKSTSYEQSRRMRHGLQVWQPLWWQAFWVTSPIASRHQLGHDLGDLGLAARSS